MHKIGFIVYPGFSAISFAVTSVFETANWFTKKASYEVTLLSENGGPVATSIGNQIETVSFKKRAFQTVMIAGDLEIPSATPALIKYLQTAEDNAERVVSVCTGAFILAKAGLLAGRKATTHWHYAAELKRLYPDVTVEADRIFVADKRIWTSAGMSAGVDLALALVEKDLGSEVAKGIAKTLVVYNRRSGGQSQFSTLLSLNAHSDRVQTALAYAKEHLSEPLSVNDLADAAFLSPRQFSRLFRAETGHTPARAIEMLRLESAKQMMEAGRFSTEEIAHKNGFGNRERMRRSFIREFGKPPQSMQRSIKK